MTKQSGTTKRPTGRSWLSLTVGLTVGVAVLGLAAADAQASGFQLAEQSARGLGNAFAGGAAEAGDASTVFFNPAGMTRFEGHQAAGSFFWIAPSGKYFDKGGSVDAFGSPLTGGEGRDGGVDAYVPVSFLVYSIDERLKAGIGINVPFGLATEFPADWKGRYNAIESAIKTINVQPSIAYKVDDHWSVGAGLNWQWIDVVLESAVDYGTIATARLGPAPAASVGLFPQANDGRAIIHGIDRSWGWNAGVLYEMDEHTRFGVHFRSHITHHLEGGANFVSPAEAAPLLATGAFANTDVKADLTLPETANLSAYHEIDDQLAVMADVQWTRWSRLTDITINYENPLQPQSSEPLNWKDTFKIAVGSNYRYDDSWTFRMGTAFDQDPTRNSTRTPRLPTDKRFWLTFGLTYQMNDHMALDFGYAHLWVKNGEVDATSAFSSRLHGKFQNSVDIFSVGGTLDF